MATSTSTSGGNNIEPLSPNTINAPAAAPEPSPAIIALAVLLSVALVALAVVFVVRHRLRAARRSVRFDTLMELQQPPLPPPPMTPTTAAAAGIGLANPLSATAPGMMPSAAAQDAMAGVGMRPAAVAALGPYPRGVWGPGYAEGLARAAAVEQQQQAARRQGGMWGAARPGNAREALRFGRPAPALRRRRDTFPAGTAARMRGRRVERAAEEAEGPGTSEEMYESDEELVRGRRERGMGEGLGRRRGRGDESDGKCLCDECEEASDANELIGRI